MRRADIHRKPGEKHQGCELQLGRRWFKADGALRTIDRTKDLGSSRIQSERRGTRAFRNSIGVAAGSILLDPRTNASRGNSGTRKVSIFRSCFFQKDLSSFSARSLD